MIIEPIYKIEHDILSLICKEVNNRFKNGRKKLENNIKNDIISEIKDTQEYSLLVKGRWRGIFGFERGKERERVNTIIDTIANSINIEHILFTPKGRNITGDFFIDMLVADYSDIFNLEEAAVINDVNIYQEIPWLELLLTRGGMRATFAKNYRVVFGNFTEESSRSTIAVMRKGGSWTIPGDGTKNDNWFTRFFSSSQFKNRLSSYINKVIK